MGSPNKVKQILDESVSGKRKEWFARTGILRGGKTRHIFEKKTTGLVDLYLRIATFVMAVSPDSVEKTATYTPFSTR